MPAAPGATVDLYLAGYDDPGAATVGLDTMPFWQPRGSLKRIPRAVTGGRL
jgi:hypothetical protein